MSTDPWGTPPWLHLLPAGSERGERGRERERGREVERRGKEGKGGDRTFALFEALRYTCTVMHTILKTHALYIPV